MFLLIGESSLWCSMSVADTGGSSGGSNRHTSPDSVFTASNPAATSSPHSVNQPTHLPNNIFDAESDEEALDSPIMQQSALLSLARTATHVDQRPPPSPYPLQPAPVTTQTYPHFVPPPESVNIPSTTYQSPPVAMAYQGPRIGTPYPTIPLMTDRNMLTTTASMPARPNFAYFPNSLHTTMTTPAVATAMAAYSQIPTGSMELTTIAVASPALGMPAVTQPGGTSGPTMEPVATTANTQGRPKRTRQENQVSYVEMDEDEPQGPGKRRKATPAAARGRRKAAGQA
ncbi:hypothetical protein CPB86DRAFT_283773 [Serendipita vermifera]|nr:hypothetical protein CPB86DRAFT_283773 [Serendipita vermifera]